MSECRFYNQGYCRFGNRCDFSHVRHNSRQSSNSYDDYSDYSTSPNRVWVNPSMSSRSDYQYNSGYREQGHQTQHNSYSNNYSSRNQYHNENTHVSSNRATSTPNFSFTKTLQSQVNKSKPDSIFNQNIPQSSIQQKLKQNNSSSSSFSFVKALQDNNVNSSQTKSFNESYYTKVEDLSNVAKVHFEADQFICGQVPIFPPPAHLC